MPTIQVDLIEVKQRFNTNNVIFTAKQDNKIITREIDIGEFDTWEVFANWIINQEPEFVLLPSKEKSLDITFHFEDVSDPLTGAIATIRVVDNVDVQELSNS